MCAGWRFTGSRRGRPSGKFGNNLEKTMGSGRSYGFAHCCNPLYCCFWLLRGVSWTWNGVYVYWLHQNGAAAEGIVINLRTDSSGDTYYAEYVFWVETESGRPLQFEREEVISRSFHSRLEPWTEVDIRYDPADPTVSRIASNQYPFLIDIIISFACIFLGVIPAIALHGLANYRFEPRPMSTKIRFWRSILRRIQPR
jgi:hypothetical protein